MVSAATVPVGRPASTAEQAEVALLLRAGRGERDAPIAELYDLYARRIYGYGLRALGDRSLAEDLVQETFVRLWRAAPRFDPERGNVSRYLFTIARNAAVDLHRRVPRGRREELPDLASDDDAFEELVTGLTVREALSSLPPVHRVVLELAYDDGLTQAEIAARLAIPVGTVKSRTHHALRALRAELADRGIDG